jgi:hypothetical protein
MNQNSSIEEFFIEISKENLHSYFDYQKENNECIMTAKYKNLSNLIYSHLYNMYNLADKHNLSILLDYTEDSKEIIYIKHKDNQSI